MPVRSLCCPLAFAACLPAQLGWFATNPTVSPTARDGAAMAFDGRGVLLFGGQPPSSNIADAETWRWDGTTWTRLQPLDAPPARSYHAMVYDPGRERVLLFGGSNQNTSFNDMWEWDRSTWRPLFPAWRPLPMWSPELAFDAQRGRVVLHGVVASQSWYQTWEWDGITWIERTPPVGPRAPSGFSMAFDPVGARTVLFTGTETWSYVPGIWSLLGAAQPPARSGMQTVLDEARRRIVLFGGDPTSGSGSYSDTWEWDGSAWSMLSLSALPAGRSGHVMAYDRLRRRIVVFGGSAYSAGNRRYFTDTWELANPNLGEFATFGSGCAGSAGTPRLDVAAAGALPNLGEVFGLRLTALPPGNPAFAYLGFSRTTWNGLALPFDLAPLGAPGCPLQVSPEFLLPLLNLGGVAPFTLAIPDDAGLLGIRFFVQGWVADPPANALGVVVSNGGTGLIGRR